MAGRLARGVAHGQSRPDAPELQLRQGRSRDMIERIAILVAWLCIVLVPVTTSGQTAPAPDRAVGDPLPSPRTDGIRQRPGSDVDSATGTFGETGRGTASGAADSRPAEGRKAPGGEETMSEPTGPGSAERRPGSAVTQ